MKHWWKILTVLLMLYVIVAGFLIPLKPGILTVSPDSADSGDLLNISVTGYNSHYTDATEFGAWLKLDSVNYIKGENIQAISPTSLIVDFQMPSALPDTIKEAYMTLVMTNDVDGYSLLPEAVHISHLEWDSLVPPVGQWELGMGDLHPSKDMTFPYRNMLEETIRNLYFHVPLWFAMTILFFIAMIYSIIYLILGNPKNDFMALALTQVGIVFGALGLITGAIWANWTWGAPWSGDIKQNMSAVAMLIYLAFLVLRFAFDDYERQARISAVYSVFAFVSLILLIFVVPRYYDSLHPGNGGNPGFGGEDLDGTMKMVFYPAVLAFILLGWWMSTLLKRYMIAKQEWLERD